MRIVKCFSIVINIIIACGFNMISYGQSWDYIEFDVFDSTNVNFSNTDVLVLDEEKFVIYWYDSHAHAWYGKFYNNVDSKVGKQFNIITNENVSNTEFSATKYDGDKFIFCYVIGEGIYCQAFDENCNKIGEEIEVNPPELGCWYSHVIIDLNDGGFVVLWTRIQDGVIGKKFDNSGNQIGDSFKVSSDDIGAPQHSPFVGKLLDGTYFVCWTVYDYWYWEDLYCQRYDSNFDKSGSKFRVGKNSHGKQWQPQILGLTLNKYIVSWVDVSITPESNGDIYAQIFENVSDKVGDRFQINSTSGVHNYYPCMIVHNEGILMSWIIYDYQAYGTGNSMLGQMFDMDGNKKGEEFIFLSPGDANFYIVSRLAALNSNTFLLCFESPDNIVVRIYYSNNVDINNEQSNNNRTLSKYFKLSQNYPNPFNQETKISYYLDESSNVKLIIYDLLGKEITTLVDDFQIKGEYDLSWDAKGLSSGIYFVKLSVGKLSKTRKLTLQR